MNQKQTYLSAILILAMVLALAGALLINQEFSNPRADAQDTSTVLVRFIHAFPTDAALDIYVDGALVVNGLSFGESTPHLRLPISEATVDVRIAGSSPQSSPFVRELVSLTTSSGGFGNIALVIQSDNFSLPAIAKIEDLLTPTTAGKGRLHVIHTASVLGTVDLVETETNAPFLANIDFNEIIGTVDPDVGLYDFAITIVGGSGSPFANLPDVHISSGYLTTILLLPPFQGPGVTVSVFQSPLAPDPTTDSSLIQFGHGSPNASSFDIYMDDELIIGGLTSGDLLSHTYFPANEYTLSIREAGSPSTITAAYEQVVDVSDSSQVYSIIALGSLEDGTFEFGIFQDNLVTPNPAATRLRVINATNNGPLTLELDNGVNDVSSIANTLSPMEATDVQLVELGVYRMDGVVDDAEINGPLSVHLDPYVFVGGSYITVLAYTADEPALSISTSTLNADIASLPGAIDAVALIPTATPTATATNTPLPPTLTPTPAVIIPNAGGTTIITETYIVATVTLNSGINLQCREYPSPLATSLGLIPNGSNILALGYAGPADPNSGEQNTPVEAGAFAQPESATSFEQIWLQIDWASPEGLVRCWVRSDFARLTLVEEGTARQLIEPADLFALATIEEPVTGRIPSNFNGGHIGTAATAPIIPNVAPAPSASPIAPTPTPGSTVIIGQIGGNSNVILLAAPSETAVPVTTLPVGGNVIINGRNADGTWLNVRYEVVGEAASEGWLLSSLITFADPSISVNNLPVIQ